MVAPTETSTHTQLQQTPKYTPLNHDTSAAAGKYRPILGQCKIYNHILSSDFFVQPKIQDNSKKN